MSSTKQKTYWRSLQELSQNEAYKEYVSREFPEGASELRDGYSRKNFLQIMGASVALAGFAACRKPVQKLLPYHKQPEEIVGGIPLEYASAVPFQDYGVGVLLTTNEGRPTKVEGNPDHDSSKGATNIFQQSSILDLYDPDRSRFVRNNGERSDWEAFTSFCADHFSIRNRGIAFVSEASGSPSVNRLKSELLSTFPNAMWATYEPFGPHNVLAGTETAFGRKLRPVYHFANADVVVSLDFDFMGLAPDMVRCNLDYANRRRVESSEDSMNRLYVVENDLSVTGSNADHRLRLKAGDLPAFVAALGSKLSESVNGLSALSGVSNEFSQHMWVSVLAQELLANRGKSIIAAGEQNSVAVHAMVAAINTALGNSGETVEYVQVPYHDSSYDPDALARVAEAVQNGQVDTVVLVGGNPVFNAPSSIDFASLMDQVDTTIHLSNHVDETSSKATWHVPRAHYLEYWGDVADYRGHLSVIQPTIQPLFGSKCETEFLSAILHGESRECFDIVRETWQSVFPTDFQTNWEKTIHDGIYSGTRFQAATASLTSGFGTAMQSMLQDISVTDPDRIEMVLKPDRKLFDGRYANNGWLQELPDPITKITWDNVAAMSPATASRFGVRERKFGETDYDLLNITVNGTTFQMPAWILPGHADNSITINVGYGRTSVGRVADDIGHNAYVGFTTASLVAAESVSMEVARRNFPIACTQNHHSMEGRPLAREATLEEYKEDPRIAADKVYVPGRREEDGHPVNLFNDQIFPSHQPQWGMAIDLNACTGCGVCTIACQAENNIPVIGKREVVRNREMHWIRIDRYFSGDQEDPQVIHQPIPCMHCEQAPCEMVCPVAATTHSDDGLNQMTYNQCIGTRYCSNNCPFKVRRFSFFNYAKNWLEMDDDPDIIQMAMNPDVSVRFRGVMEKCTYCVQRINRAKIATKNATGNSIKPADGTVKTACQQACPSQAITFGDLTDDNSIISRTKRNDRNYVMLEEINIRPRTSYLAKLRNVNNELA
ncbi:quinol:cytochrome c oxidoreductase iron-sulfur protein precursor [Cyclonatronum proteinivorum]|uniref:Quinol:cytochrome c oxidoreductase iron-sulfur protein n=1 Tax=Cyclonatronum proteinivorum TaxID=1457365 RepID=A0A345UP20_9BACT|nr:TAT-variant-translocated molybdopterin oxidoreductase [Cyclonatronum proteinivorum]AXJ02222.1 quinol:cytochrome c oxidoreductase iron-sulfur protein precursor [Cyclonatronum proteinivorum]